MLAAIAMTAYCANRFLHAFDGILPQDLLRFQFGDACGGMLFPVYVNLVAIAAHSPMRVDSIGRMLVLELACSIAWEVIAPAMLPASVGDLLDVLAYFTGGVIYIIIWKWVKHERRST